jgi:hypothetical protein
VHAIRDGVANLALVVVAKSEVPTRNIASLAALRSFGDPAARACLAAWTVLIGLMFGAGCGDAGENATLVRFQSAKAKFPWRVSEAGAGDAGGDAALDASTLDSGEADAGRILDAGAMDEEDAGEIEERDAAPPKAKPVTACSFKVTTKSQGGRYAPKNIGAIWIERENGEWVKTLAQWAGVRLRYLPTYLKANTARNTMDAMTSATLRQHGSHEVKWNLSDGSGKPVPDGKYQVRVEVTDRDSTGQMLSLPFSKSSEALEIELDDNSYFVDVSLNCS